MRVERWGPGFAIAGLAATLGLYGAGMVLRALRPEVGPGDFTMDDVAFFVPFVAFAPLGALVAVRRPDNPLGVLMTVVAVLVTASYFAGEYATRGLVVAPGALPGADVASWLATWVWLPGSLAFAVVLLRFPDGRLPTPRWRWLERASWLTLAVLVPGVTLLWRDRGAPLVVEGVGNLRAAPNGWLVSVVGNHLGVWIFAASAASLLFRFRRARGDARQQLKWLAFAAAALVMFVPMSAVLPLGELVFGSLMLVGLAGVPVSIAIAILRFRLYDIDRIINRTVVYAIVTAVLGGCYVGLVVALQALLRPLSGESDLAVAASTLAIAAAFGPVRRRVRSGVDRRFNRSRYDAVRTVDGFGQRLRDELSLEALAGELRATVTVAVQPARIDLWLAPDAEGTP
ncbi:MAG: hypothetical protein M3N57_12955 [Actinomycetota bacterium]|nr:hypothetical protein [Actinomycetota bacterium]